MPNSYDEVPYDSYPYAQTHPERLAVVAMLFGVRPPSLPTCRVLELGCGSGGNLIPMALSLPGASFLGIDLSLRQVEVGRQTIDTLGLTNIELRHQNLLDVTPELGRFDYILCHGVYSWVPPDVQDKILEVCARNLTPHGIAYVSYNTYPGWHMRGMIRDIMCYHAQDFAQPLVRVKHARNLIDFLARSVVDPNSSYGLLLRNEVELIRNKADSYLFHDHMEEVNDPVYFHQFAERAAAKGVYFLGEVDMNGMLPGSFSPEVDNVLKMLSADRIRMEQYKDFLTNRTFRQTLLTLRETAATLALRREHLAELFLASPATPKGASAEGLETFAGTNGIMLGASQPLTKAALHLLCEAWPDYVSFNAMLAEARRRRGGADADADVDELVVFLLSAYASAPNAVVELHLAPPPFATQAGDFPTAAPLARLQAGQRGSVTNLRHQTVGLDDFDRALLGRLDGQTDRVALAAALGQWVAAGDFNLNIDGKPPRDAAELDAAIRHLLDQRLPHLAHHALLIA